jgi:hypothetical protein
MKNQLALVCTAVALVSSCAPRTGPSESDDGLTLFWRVAGDADVTVGDDCSDNEGFTDAYAPVGFEPNSYLTYRVDGSVAVATSCDRLLASSCTDADPEIVFDIDGNTLTASPPRTSSALDSGDCTVHLDQVWRVDDNGEAGVFTISQTISLEGADCAQANDQIAVASPNGKGIDGCLIEQEVPLEFDAAR